ncbi:Extracellular ligand-binding receptor [Desulfitobacterium hafniense DCB-2]|uniref:Extracellular ligand-binding receptor n=1 Tax=Desulfitobacterium hafniense (strain DSM 10664 / DCB-2) TaxID=272564 RepID=B8FZ96_DESHD|nr:ABC transporter substrate-binding protein [Desulfitobacterium hafniense]ACL18179.1 Extracellular ligand-binding receptor [Desulfitobacterium hafniense DCB-2]
MLKSRVIKKSLAMIFILGLSLWPLGCTQVNPSEEIFIGVAWPFASLDDLFAEGLELAVQEINEQGGVQGRKLSLVKADDEAELEKGLAIAQAFADNAGIQAVIGHRNSFISIPAASIYDQAGLVMLSPASTSPDLTDHGYIHVFRNIPSDQEIARQLAIYLAEQGHERMVIYYTDDSYGNGLANAFEDYARAQGITIVDRFNYYGNLKDLERLYDKWQAFGMDGIFIAKTATGGGTEFLVDAKSVGIEVPLIAGNSWDALSLTEDIENIGMTAEGLLVGSFFNPQRPDSRTQDFVEAFRREYGQPPTSYAAAGYDAVILLAEALEKSDLTHPATLAQGLRDLGPWEGVMGMHRFDGRGDDIGDLVVLKKMKDGRFEYLGH